MIRRFINQVVRGEHLSRAEMTEAMELIIQGQAKPSQTAAFLVALRVNGESVTELAAAAEVVRSFSPRIQIQDPAIVLDRDEINIDEETVSKTCSLNGNETRTFNISTATAFVVAAAGLKVAKSGSRAESPFCGSANVVAALGVNLDLTLTEVERCIDQVGIGFLYASLFHSPLAHPTRIREEIGVQTIFNSIGPLINPARATRQILGVYYPERTEFMAKVLLELGYQEAMVVHGQDTLDELSVTGPSVITHLKNGFFRTITLTPGDLGWTTYRLDDISGGVAERNASIIREILNGQPGPRRQVVLLNAAAAFIVAGVASDWQTGVALAAEAIDSGRAKSKLEALIDFTARCGVYQHRDFS